MEVHCLAAIARGLRLVAAAATLAVGVAHAAPFAFITNTTDGVDPGFIRVIDVANPGATPLDIPMGDAPEAVAAERSGRYVWIADRAGTVFAIEVATMTIADSVDVGASTLPRGIAVDPAGAFVYVTQYDEDTVSVIDTSTFTVVDVIAVGAGPLGVAVDPTNTWVYVTNDFDGTVSVISTATKAVVDTITVEDGPVGVAFNPAGTRAYVANNFSDTITVIDPLAAHSVLETLPVDAGPFGLAITPDGNELWATHCCADTVSVINIQADANDVVDSLDMGVFSGPEGISIDPLGRFAYVAKVGANEVAIIDVASRTEIGPLVPMFTLNSTLGNFISASPPAPPTAVAATAGNTQATVTFTPPTLNGGQPVTGYSVTSNPPGGVDSNAGSTSTSHIVTGLNNGTAYTFTVTATNSIGTGEASAASNSVTPLGTPGAPTGATATAGNGQATVTFTAPASNGGSAITGYTVTSNPAGGVDSNAGTTGTSHVVTGLTNGTAYTFTVTATNAIGTSAASAPSNSVTPLAPPGPPGAPTGVTATAGNAQATVTFTAPASNGGSAITGYTVTSNPAGGVDSNAGTTGTSHVVTGLINGTAYTFTVTATNAAGTSAPSAASNSVTPSNNVFSGPTATGSGTATVSFTGGGAACAFAPPGNGALESAFFIAVSGHPKSPPAGSAPPGVTFVHGLLDFVLVGCTPGSTVSFTVTYPSALDPGTLYFKYGPTPGSPAPQWYVLPATIAGNTATFSITDGALGDDDLAANGTVVDQGGPGGPPSEPRQVPALSEWALLLMTVLLMLTGVGAARRRKAIR